MNVISGMAGTPSCGAWVCKCVGGLVEETEIRKHFDSAAKMKLHDGRLEANRVRRAMHAGRYRIFTQAMQDAQVCNASVGVARRGMYV